MQTGVDILENELYEEHPGLLEVLLADQTSRKNILWASHDYEHRGKEYRCDAEIKPGLITGKNGHLIMPRALKNKDVQKMRSKDMAEVFTPTWICNAQNNLVDEVWFGRRNVFNQGITTPDGSKSWISNSEKINFPRNKTWEDYIKDTRLEVACGEAPYVTSRYDSTNGEFIPVQQRIGILDRKLRVLNENVDLKSEWLGVAQIAFESTYAFEWQGDSLLLAREAMLFTFIENYLAKFDHKPNHESIVCIANILSWNVWQMDGIRGVIPNTCKPKIANTASLFGDVETEQTPCEGCEKMNINSHNGTSCFIKDWSKTDLKTGQRGRKVRFVDLLSGKGK